MFATCGSPQCVGSGMSFEPVNAGGRRHLGVARRILLWIHRRYVAPKRDQLVSMYPDMMLLKGTPAVLIRNQRLVLDTGAYRARASQKRGTASSRSMFAHGPSGLRNLTPQVGPKVGRFGHVVQSATKWSIIIEWIASRKAGGSHSVFAAAPEEDEECWRDD